MTATTGARCFAHEVGDRSRAGLERCSQCLTCGTGCPIAFALDYTPNQLIRLIQLGMKNRVLDSSAIWLCASCQTCTSRCPQDVNIVAMMDALRQMALREGRVREKPVAAFHAAFMASVRESGRVNELSMMTRYLATAGQVFKRLPEYLRLGLGLAGRGKLAMRRERAAGKDIRRMFRSRTG